jgi:hypothetical protein
MSNEVSTLDQSDDVASIVCDLSHKLLTRVTTQGIMLFCRNCKREHCLPWTSILGMIAKLALRRDV